MNNVFIYKQETGYFAQAEGMASIWSKAPSIEAVKLQFLMEYQDLPIQWNFIVKA